MDGAAPRADLAELRAALGKKKSFIKAAHDLVVHVESTYRDAPADEKKATLDVISRLFSLLRSRFTTEPYWTAGRRVFCAAAAQDMASGSDTSSQLLEWVAAADLELKDIARAADATELEDAAAGARQAHDGAPGPGEAHSSMPDPDTFAGMFAGAVDLSSLLSQLRDVDLSDLLASGAMPEEFDSGTGDKATSRHTRAALPMVRVGQERAENREACAICLEDFGKTSCAKQLPCGHLFHDDCIVPWLEKHNSCPNCRHELPEEKRGFSEADVVLLQEGAKDRGMYC